MIAVVGAVTALFAATIAVAQNDIKKVLAYSTVSQLGYMFLAVGSGAYVAAIFHMITHAFFKALLFLGSGSVIHGMHDEQDMRQHGRAAQVHADHRGHVHHRLAGDRRRAAVRRLLVEGRDPRCSPATRARSLYVVGLVTALLTAYYMTRQVIMVFFGKARWEDARTPEHGAPRRRSSRTRARRSCSLPLVVLAVLSIVGGRHQPAVQPTTSSSSSSWLEPVVEFGERNIDGTWADDHLYAADGRSPSSSSLVGIVARLRSSTNRHRVKAVEPEVLADGWYYDEAVTAFMGGPGREAFEDVAVVRPARHRRRRQRRRQASVRAAGRRAAHASRPATSATTPASSASARSLLLGLVRRRAGVV